MTYDSEIFSLQIEPPQDSQDKAVVMRLCGNGKFLMFETDPFSFTDKIGGIHAIKLKPGPFLNSLIFAAEEGIKSLTSCPSELFIENASDSQYILSIKGNTIVGNFAFGNLEDIKNDYTKDEIKMIKWNNKVVAFINHFTDVLSTEDLIGMIIKESPLLHLLNPLDRYLIQETIGCLDGAVSVNMGIDNVVKAALKKALMGNGNINGEAYNGAFVAIRQKFLPFLDTSRTKVAFDKGHDFICRSLTSIEGFDYPTAAYSLDLAYIYALLEGNLIQDERKVSFLHTPVSPLEMLDLGLPGDAASICSLVARSRKEGEILNISPAYMYLQSLCPKDDTGDDDDKTLPTHMA